VRLENELLDDLFRFKNPFPDGWLQFIDRVEFVNSIRKRRSRRIARSGGCRAPGLLLLISR
jgi:hypothetical protein